MAEGEIGEPGPESVVETGYFSGPEEGQGAQTRSKIAYLGTPDWKS